MDITADYRKGKNNPSTMLKWAVNKPLPTEPRMSIFIDDAPATPTTTRRSLGTSLPQQRARDPARDLRRKSLGNNAAVARQQRRQNKENHIMVTPHPITMRNSPVTSNSPIVKADGALREIGNLTPNANNNSFNTTPIRKPHLPPSPSPRARHAQPAAQVKPFTSSSTLPTLDVEYSPACGIASGPAMALRSLTIVNNFLGNARYFQDEQISSVLAQKPKLETPCMAPMFKTHMEEEDDLNMSSKALDDKALNQMIDEILESTRKVKSCHVAAKRPRVETIDEISYCDIPSALNNNSPLKANLNLVQSPECQLRRQRCVVRRNSKASKKSLANCVTPEFLCQLEPSQIEMFAGMSTPKEIRSEERAINSATSKQSCESTPGIAEQDVQGSSTPTESPKNIRRCLQFPDSPDSMEDSLEKRKSVASSTASTTSSRCSKSSAPVAGSLDLCLSSSADDRQINVHVIRCKDLCRSNGGPVNAYVKVAMMSSVTNSNENGFQRTTVQRNSMKPSFDHRFVFEPTTEDLGQRIQLSVWHRDREYKRSEFLGCMSFPLHSFHKKQLAGSFKLQPQSCLTTPAQAILIENFATNSEESDAHQLSQKALQQRDADENLFLRFLEIDTNMVSEDGIPHNAHGRTPFTLTKQITRDPELGFGLSIVWTHPPRIEKVEPGQAADRAGIVPGDFVIFVDKQNVVTTAESDVLNLIRSQGDTLSLEVFRRSNQSIQNFGVAPAGNDERAKRCQPDLGHADNVFDRHVNKRQRIAFSQDVGSGIIV